MLKKDIKAMTEGELTEALDMTREGSGKSLMEYRLAVANERWERVPEREKRMCFDALLAARAYADAQMELKEEDETMRKGD